MKKTIFLFMLFSTILINKLPAQEKMPNHEQRIYSLSLIWKEMHYSFAFPETLQQVNIDSLYMTYLPKVEQAKSNFEYFRVLSSFMAHFNEAHTRIYTSHRPDDVPPLKTINFDKKIVISNISKSMVDKIPLGSEIIKINQIPVLEYIRDSVYQYISAATPHWKFDKSVSEMFYGRPYSKVKITVITPKGKEKEVEMIRNYNSNGLKEIMADTIIVPPINIKIIHGNIGYIQLTSFARQYLDTINSIFSRNIQQLKKCKGLIIDLRGNRGGTDQAWENIAYHLLSNSKFQIDQGKWLCRKYITSYKMWGEHDSRLKDYYLDKAMEEIKHQPYTNNLNDSLKLHQPLIVISGPFVGSSAEDFLTLIKQTGRAVVVGGPSVGSMGEAMFITLPGDFGILISAKKFVNSDGSQPNKTGILPDIEVKRDYNAYLKGRDNVLERAIEELWKQVKK